MPSGCTGGRSPDSRTAPPAPAVLSSVDAPPVPRPARPLCTRSLLFAAAAGDRNAHARNAVPAPAISAVTVTVLGRGEGIVGTRAQQDSGGPMTLVLGRAARGADERGPWRPAHGRDHNEPTRGRTMRVTHGQSEHRRTASTITRLSDPAPSSTRPSAGGHHEPHQRQEPRQVRGGDRVPVVSRAAGSATPLALPEEPTTSTSPRTRRWVAALAIVEVIIWTALVAASLLFADEVGADWGLYLFLLVHDRGGLAARLPRAGQPDRMAPARDRRPLPGRQSQPPCWAICCSPATQRSPHGSSGTARRARTWGGPGCRRSA